MPVKYFSCPSGETIKIEDCLKRCGKPEGRCHSLRYLKNAGSQREWKGIPSTTQLINGTRYAYLELMYDYAIKPEDRAFAILGTRAHERLDVISKKLNVLSEEKLPGDVTGILDCLEPDETKEGFYILWDNKTWGSYKIQMSLGLVATKVPDPSGEVYQKKSKYGNAGDPKMIDQWTRNPSQADTFEVELQLNHYRLKIEEVGFPVSQMFIEAIVRDGDTITANQRGVDEKTYKIEVKRMDDDVVRGYFDRKKTALLQALESKTLPPMCSERENWNGRRCKKFCPLVQWCPEGSAMR